MQSSGMKPVHHCCGNGLPDPNRKHAFRSAAGDVFEQDNARRKEAMI